jgi:MOSC domain-containing protein YiiM
MAGAVEHIFLADPESPTYRVDSVLAIRGRGLEGDRHLAPEDSWAMSGCAITLIEAEEIEAIREEHGIDLGEGRSRRQVVTRGMRLNDLVGQEFSVGEVRCRGVELCEPCQHLARLLGEPNLINAALHRAGLRADILAGGRIAVGDSVASPTAAPPAPA